jgi:hypothetical protein
MEVNEIANGYSIATEAYRIEAAADRAAVYSNDERLFVLSIRSAIHQVGAEDVDCSEAAPGILQAERSCLLSWTARSSLWERKEYLLECFEDSFTYRVRVCGQGRLAGLDYFSGAGYTRPPGSEYDVASYLRPVALGGGADDRYFTTAQPSTIELGYLCPPMFCYPFRLDAGRPWLGLGLVARPGQHNFDHFAYKPLVDSGRPRFVLQTDLRGYTMINGMWESPAILCTSGETEWDVLSAYSQWHYAHGYCDPRVRDAPRWWHGPLFCGWGEQCAVSPENPQSAATQADYTRMSGRLDELGLRPSAIIIDDKWQKYYGESLPDTQKWPDLRAFADSEHAQGRKVMLWFKAWNSEGIPADECVTLWGQPHGVDPTNPAYQARLRETVRVLLSSEAGCYDCDGFKVDFANVMPLGDSLTTYEPGIYGVELLRRLFSVLYEAVKSAKPDALLNCSSCHPYFAEFVDQARLHDYYWGMRSARSVMGYRARLFQAAIPGVLIDTDGVVSTHRETMDYMRFACELGVPDLYTLSGGPDVRFTEEDWREIREMWESYSGRA